MTTNHDLMVCTDCIVFIANDDLTEARRAEILEGVRRWSAEGYYLVAGDDHEIFSWDSCDVCGSHLGGERHGAAALCRKENQ